MQIEMLKSKIHRATVKQAELDYVGSITIDEDLLDAAGILGMICLNGAAAHCVSLGDKVIIMCYAQMTPEEVKENKPKVVFVDDDNKITRLTNYEKHGRLFDLEK